MAKVGRPRTNFEYPSCMGGYTFLNAQGYIREYVPNHPNCDKCKTVLQHRLIVELYLGRFLTADELVHHKDENKLNNDIGNLQIMGWGDHTKHHHLGIPDKPLAVADVKKALKGRTTTEAAALLNVHHNTLRRRFDSLLRKRKTPSKMDDPVVVEQVRKAAADSSVSVKDFAKQSGISFQFAMKVCQKYGMDWVKKSRKGELHRTWRGKKPKNHGQLIDDAGRIVPAHLAKKRHVRKHSTLDDKRG